MNKLEKQLHLQISQMAHLLNGGILSEEDAIASGLGVGVLIDQKHAATTLERRAIAAEKERDELREDKARLETQERNFWAVIPEDEPTGGDDADVGWHVIEYHMAKPHERRIGYGKTPRQAIDAAIRAARKEP